MTVCNVIFSMLMIKLLVFDRTNLGGIYDPLYKFDGCYETPYVYLDEYELITWPGVSRRALFYILFNCFVWPSLLFFHAYKYRQLLTETMRIAGNPELLVQENQPEGK